MTEFVQRTLSLFEAWSVPPDRATSLVDQLHRDITHAALSISDNKQLQPALADTIGAFVELYATASPSLRRELGEPTLTRAQGLLTKAVTMAAANARSCLELQNGLSAVIDRPAPANGLETPGL
jgi:hypothetical protein